jgi:hypothetical protein
MHLRRTSSRRRSSRRYSGGNWFSSAVGGVTGAANTVGRGVTSTANTVGSGAKSTWNTTSNAVTGPGLRGLDKNFIQPVNGAKNTISRPLGLGTSKVTVASKGGSSNRSRRYSGGWGFGNLSSLSSAFKPHSVSQK